MRKPILRAKPVSKEEAMALLTPHSDRITTLITEAWEDFRNHIALTQFFEQRTLAGIVRDLMVARAKVHFSDVGNAHILVTKDLFLVDIGDRLQLRFKKFRKDNRTSNYPTQQALDFHRQLELPAIGVKARIDVGYRPNADWTQIEAILMSCRAGKKIDWLHEFGAPEAHVVPMPFAPVPTTSTSNVRGKGSETKPNTKHLKA